MLDREGELAALARCLDDAERGEGRVVAIEGPAGIGKTSLLDAARQAASGRGAQVLAARATELETGYPFGVVRQLFERAVAAGDAARELFAGAAARARPIFDGGGSEPAGDGFAILHGLYWLTANLADRRPLLLAIDDAQWCDAPSLRYLAHLAPRVDELAILVVAARRVGEHPVDEEALDALTSDATTTRLAPGGLGDDAVAELLRRALGTSPDGAFVSACREATAANPLLVRELARALASAGVPPTADSVAAIPELGPGAVSRFVLRRLARLAPPARAVAESVAVLGDGCSLAAAAEHGGVSQTVAADAAGSLALAELLAAGTPLRFVHPLVREAVYRQLGAGERAAAHARAAAVVGGQRDPVRVGLHLLQAPPGAVGGAVEALREAARAAEADGDPVAAASFRARLLEEPLGRADRVEELIPLGAVELRFDPRRAAARLREALEGLERPGERAQVALLLGRALYMSGAQQEAAAVLEDALAGLGDGDGDLAYRLQSELLGPLSELFEVDRAQEILERAAASGVRGHGLGARMLRAQLAATPRVPLARREYVALAAEAVADDVLLEDDTSDVYSWVSTALLNADEFGLAREALDRAVEHGRRRGSAQMLTSALKFRSRLHLLLGDLADAEVDARAALAAFDLHRLPAADPYVASALCDALVARGELEEAAGVLGASSPAQQSSEPTVVVLSRVELALARGQPASALPLVEAVDARTGAPYERAGVPKRWGLAHARALVAVGRRDDGAALAAAELARARAWGAPRLLAQALRAAALACDTCEELPLLEDAVAALEGSPAKLERARTLAALGSATRRAGRRADARESLREALELAHVCRAVLLEREIHDELVVAGARPRRARLSGLEALTPSESRVARLAGEGRTNREIAQELFVTLKTVEMHLASSYRKLGISSRGQLPALLAAEAGA